MMYLELFKNLEIIWNLNFGNCDIFSASEVLVGVILSTNDSL